jgi:hypothetical protein
MVMMFVSLRNGATRRSSITSSPSRSAWRIASCATQAHAGSSGELGQAAIAAAAMTDLGRDDGEHRGLAGGEAAGYAWRHHPADRKPAPAATVRCPCDGTSYP